MVFLLKSGWVRTRNIKAPHTVKKSSVAVRTCGTFVFTGRSRGGQGCFAKLKSQRGLRSGVMFIPISHFWQSALATISSRRHMEFPPQKKNEGAERFLVLHPMGGIADIRSSQRILVPDKRTDKQSSRQITKLTHHRAGLVLTRGWVTTREQPVLQLHLVHWKHGEGETSGRQSVLVSPPEDSTVHRYKMWLESGTWVKKQKEIN